MVITLDKLRIMTVWALDEIDIGIEEASLPSFVLHSWNECQWTAIAQDRDLVESLDSIAVVGLSNWTWLKMEEC